MSDVAIILLFCAVTLHFCQVIQALTLHIDNILKRVLSLLQYALWHHFPLQRCHIHKSENKHTGKKMTVGQRKRKFLPLSVYVF